MTFDEAKKIVRAHGMSNPIKLSRRSKNYNPHWVRWDGQIRHIDDVIKVAKELQKKGNGKNEMA